MERALLRPRPRGPEKATPPLGPAPCSSMLDDPLVQWRLRRCRGEEPTLDTPVVSRALLGSAAPQGALQGAVPWESRDPPEAPWPITGHLRKHQGASSPQAVSQEPWGKEPCWKSHDTCKAPWPMRSSSLDTLQGALYSQSRDSHEASWQISSRCCASLHQGAPPCGKRESHEPLRQEPLWEPQDCLGALRCVPDWRPCDSQRALQLARESLPESLRLGWPGLRSRDRCEAPQPLRSSARDALQGALLQQPLALLAQEVPCGSGQTLLGLPPPVTCRTPRPSAGPPPLDAAMPPPSHKGTPSGHRDPPGMPTWVPSTHGGANKAVTPQNCTIEVQRLPKSPSLPPPPLRLPPVLSLPICPQEYLGGSGCSKEGVGGVFGVSRGSMRVSGVFGGPLRLQKDFGGCMGSTGNQKWLGGGTGCL
ncbi:uncharacterized protein LOC134562406 isoform X3 [Prinia subflava]|uniref:uncharacterized protein LOC134562406 isoform X3 n=1 Tax=Prinia subflava TaxID=208062 RepID=UPI002FE1CA09